MFKTIAILALGACLMSGCSTYRPLQVQPQIGDVLAVNGSSPMGAIIQWRTVSHFDHVANIISTNEVIDALPGGIKVRPISRYFKSNYVLLRPVVPLTPAQSADMLAFLKAQCGKGYDFLGVLGFTTCDDIQVKKRWFCSELVFVSFQKVGVSLVPRKTEGLIAPELVYQSLVFYAVDWSDPKLLRMSPSKK